ncbi:hemagglutinin repeat-containing protein [Comamonas sp. 23]|uniref:hemagglutinin repeat-containing protein n=1 Tax=Comamonas sp. 23 TaxID=3415008 RepID=UPI003C6FB993
MSERNKNEQQKPQATRVFSDRGKKRIAATVMWAHVLTQASLGVLPPAYAQTPPLPPAPALPAMAPIADPRAPMAFQPGVESLSSGASLINITTPNAAGLSLNQYQRFDVPEAGVVLNNSQIGGRPLLGGTAGANPNLAGGTANTIVNEVTVQGSPSQINGTVEVFGNPAAVIIANPSGISCNGCGVVNTPRLSFSTGSITLQDVNGASSNFDLASGIGYNVQGGQISIDGRGVEGTVGQIDLVGELLRINGPLRAHYLNPGISSINLTAGKSPNAATQTADANALIAGTAAVPGTTVAIDASALGAMTAGRITVVSTDAGMGVNLRGPLLAYQEDVDIRSAGRVNTGDVAASRNIRINADGFVVAGGNVAANEQLQVSGNDGVLLTGPARGNQQIALSSSQGSVSTQGPLVTAGDLNVQAAQAVRLESRTGASQIVGNTQLRGNTVSVAGAFQGGGDVSIQARDGASIAGDATIGGNLQMQTGGDAALFGRVQVNRDAQVTASNVRSSGELTVGQNLQLSGAQSVDLQGNTTVGQRLQVDGGEVTLGGDIDAGQTDVTAQQLNLGGSDGNLNARGDLNLNVSQSFHNTGQVNVSGSFGLNTGGDARFDGAVTTGSGFGVNAGGDIAINNTVNSGGSINLNAGNNLQVGDTLTAGGGINGSAGGNIALNGQANSAGSQNWRAQGDFSATQGLQGNNVSIQGHNVNVAGPVLGQGAVNIAATDQLQLGSEVRANGNVALSSSQGSIRAQDVFSNGSVSLQSQTHTEVQNVQAGGDIAITATAGPVTAEALLAGRDLSVNAQDRIRVAGELGAGRNAAVTSSQADVQLANASAGGNLSLHAAQSLQVAGGASAGGNATLTSQNAGVSAQSLLANGDINTQAAGDIAIAGEVASGGHARLASTGGKVDVGGAVYGAQGATVQGSSVTLGQGLQSGGAATITASTGDITSGAGIASVGDLSLQSAGATQVAGSVQSAGQVALQSGGDTRINGDLIAEQGLQAQVGRNGGGSLVANTVASGGNASLAAGSIDVQDVQVTGAAQLQAQQDIRIAQNLMASAITTESVAGNTTVGGQVGTAGALDMRAGGNIAAGQVVAGVAGGAATSIQADGTVQLASLQTGGDYVGRAGQDHAVSGEIAVQGHADVQAGGNILAGSLAAGAGLQAQAGGDIVVDGDALVIGSAQLQSAGAQRVAGNLQVTDQLVADAQGGLQVGGDLVANNGLQVSSSAGALQVGGMLGTQGHALVDAQQGIQVAGNVLAQSVDVRSSAGAIALGGQLATQGDATLQAQQDIAIAGPVAIMGNLQASSTAGSISFEDQLQVAGDFSGHAHKDLNFLGDSLLLGQVDLKADTGRILNQGNMTFGQAVNIDTSGDLVNEGTLQSQGDISIRARNIDSNLASQGGIATAGTLDLQASGGTRLGQSGTLSAAQDIRLQSASGTQSAGTIQAGQDLHYAGGTLSNSGTVVAQNADIDAGLANQGKVYIQNQLGVTGSSSNSGEIAANTLTMAALDNSGKVGAQSASLGSTSNAGEITATTIDISGGLSNTGAVSAGDSLTVGGGNTSNDGSITGGTVSISGGSISNGGQIQSSGAMQIAGGSFENRLQETKSCALPGGCSTPDSYEYSQKPGTVSAGTTLSINTSTAHNQGVIHAGSDITINSALNNERSTNDPYTSGGASGAAVSGIISAGGNLTVTGASLQNSGQLQAADAVQITTAGAFANTAPSADVAGQVLGQSVQITAGSVSNDGMVLAQAGNAQITATSGAIANQGSIVASGDLALTATGAVSNGKDGKLLAENIAIKGNSFSNAGIVYGQNAPPSTISIETTGAFSNAATGVVIAGETLDIQAGGYSNAGGTVGSLQDASLTMAGTYTPAGNALVALGSLDLNVGGISVGAGESWNVASQDVRWTGTLHNQGTVAIAGNADGTIRNEATGTRDRAGAPDISQGAYAVDAPPAGLTGAQVISYTDVANRAQLYIGGTFTGHLDNIASDAQVSGAFSLNQQDIDQTVVWEGKDANGDTVQMTGTSVSKPRLDTSAGATELTLTGPNIGTIVGDSLIINGGDITIKPPIDPSTGLPLITDAQNTQVNAGNAQAGDGSGTTTGAIKPLVVENAQAIKYSDGEGTDTSGAGAGAGNNAGAGDTGSAGTPVAGNGDGPAPTTPERGLNLKDPIFQTPEGAVAVLMGAGFSPQWSDWSQLRVVPGGLSANDLQLNLSGQFINHGRLDVTNQLIINAAQGIDNFGASISAGGTASLNGKYLNNDNGLIQAGTLVTDIKGDISNNRGRIVASNGGFLKADGNISATEGQFISDAGKFVLDAGGDVDLIASKVVGQQGVGINAGGNVNLGVKQTTQTTHADKNSREYQAWNNSATGSDTFVEGIAVIDSRQTSTSTATTSVGTTIDSADGSVAIAAGGKLAITGGSINAGQDVLLRGAEVSVRAARDTTVTEQAQSRTVDGRVTDSQTSTTHSESYSGGTVTAGGKVAVIANTAEGDTSKGSGNVLLAGSRIEGKQGVGISATGNVALQALQAESTTTSNGQQTTYTSTRTEGQSASVKNYGAAVSSSEGDVQIGAKGTVDVLGSNVSAGKDIVIQGASVNVQATKDSIYTNDYEKSGRKEHRLAQSNETLKGGEITADGGITLIANGTPVSKPTNPRSGTGTPDDPKAVKPTEISSGKGPGNITLQGATVTAKGNTALIASGDVNLLDVQTEHDRYEESYSKSSGFLSSKRTTTVDTGHASLSEGTVVSGDKVYVQAGQDINLRGSHVVGQESATLVAEGNVSILAGQDVASAESFKETKKSGIFGSGGLGFTIGSSTTSTTHTNDSTRAAASSVQAQGGKEGENKKGDVTIVAGGHYQQTGSAVLAAGDINVVGKTVSIDEAREIEKEKFEMRAKQSGLTVSISSPIISAVQTAQSLGNAIGKTSDGRTQALGLAAGGLYAYNNAGSVQQDATQLMNGEMPTNIGINVSLGTSQSRSTSTYQQNTGAGSAVHADGNVHITATEGDLKVRGSAIDAGKDISLKADKGNIVLEASQNAYTTESGHSSSSASIGVGFNVGSSGVGFNVNAGYNQGSGQGSGSGVSYNNTTVKAGGNVSLQSAGDTTLRGATVAGNSVKADVGGNLTIESLQNKDNYNEHSSNSGFGVVIPIGAGMPGLTVSHGNTNIDSNYQSTGTQSGIRAGDGGFQVNVAGDTTLKGGAITSTQKAVDEGKNSFHTGGQLVMSDLQNQAEYNASGSQITLGVGGSLGSSSAGVGRDNGSASSTTQAGISGIAGNTSTRTGDKETGLKPIFDKDRVSDNVNAGITVTTVLGKEGSTTIGHYADKKEGELRQQADLAADPAEKARLNQEADQWAEGGVYRTALHTALGGITGGASGAAGAASSATVIPIIGEQVANLNLPKPVADAIVQGVAVAVGATAGGTEGVITSVNGTVNNYLSKSPYRNVRSLVNKANARLVDECGATCTEAQYRAIDQQIAKLDTASTLVEIANHSQLTTDQAMTLADTLSVLLPVYGTPIALYQALTGQSAVTSEDLSTVQRFLNGVIALLPAATSTYRAVKAMGERVDVAIVEGAGGALNPAKTVPYRPNGSVVLQGNAPVCGPACATMVITDETGVAVSLENTIGSFQNGIRPTGVNAVELSNVISAAGVKNTVETALFPNQLNQALSNGNTVIVNVNNHFIIVDGVQVVEGAAYYLTRDPSAGPRGVLSTILNNAMSFGANAVIVGK